MTKLVSVAIPVRNGADVLERTLASVRAQRLDPSVSLEVIVCDSASTDASASIARAYGAEVIEISVERFSHGGTRNLLMSRAQGEHVAFLTQDAVPADQEWLARLLSGFTFGPDVALSDRQQKALKAAREASTKASETDKSGYGLSSLDSDAGPYGTFVGTLTAEQKDALIQTIVERAERKRQEEIRKHYGQ